jgi:hypothetical protein
LVGLFFFLTLIVLIFLIIYTLYLHSKFPEIIIKIARFILGNPLIKLSSQYIIIVISLFFIIFFLSYIPHAFGNDFAGRIIEGKEMSCPEIDLYLKESTITLSNKTLILVMHYMGNYYIVEKIDPAPKYSNLYIISDTNVKMAKLA